MTPTELDDQLLTEAFLGDEDAKAFARSIALIASVWDDLIDGDNQVPPEKIHAAFVQCLFTLQDNPFYRAHEYMLRPVLFNGYVNWRIANEIERSGDEALLEQAHVLRYSPGDAVTLAVAIKAGMQHAIKWGPALRSSIQRDRLDNYLKEHSHAQT